MALQGRIPPCTPNSGWCCGLHKRRQSRDNSWRMSGALNVSLYRSWLRCRRRFSRKTRITLARISCSPIITGSICAPCLLRVTMHGPQEHSVSTCVRPSPPNEQESNQDHDNRLEVSKAPIFNALQVCSRLCSLRFLGKPNACVPS